MGLILPQKGVGVEAFVQAHLLGMRAPLKEVVYFTPAGRQVVRRQGERLVRGPGGVPIRVVELPSGGNQIEHGDHLHAVVRPGVVTLDPTTT